VDDAAGAVCYSRCWPVEGDITPEVAAGALHSSGGLTDTEVLMRTHISRIRKKVALFGVKINTKSQYGYVLDADNLKKARALIYG